MYILFLVKIITILIEIIHSIKKILRQEQLHTFSYMYCMYETTDYMSTIAFPS